MTESTKCRTALLVAALVSLAACSKDEPDAASVLFLVEQERGTDEYRTRMIATKRFLRIDDGEGSKNFVLFDRGGRVIYTVNATASRIMVIDTPPAGAAEPMAMKHRIERPDSKAPPVAGRPAIHYRLFTNDELCYDVFAVDGLLPEALAALKEFHRALAGEQAVTLGFTPKEMLNGCEVANNVFLPTRHLDHGFPVRWSNSVGKRSQLTDYQVEVPVDAGLFELPGSYTRFKMGER